MKSFLTFLGVLACSAAVAAKNPFPVLASCNLVLYDAAGGPTVVSKSKEVILPAYQIAPSAELLLSGTRNGKTYIFSASATRNNGTDHMFIQISKYVGDEKVQLASAVASNDIRLEPGATANGVYYVLEANKQVGYFACGMYVRPAE